MRLPGTNEQGAVDYGYLRSWAEQVRSRAASCDRLGICDYTLGEFIAGATVSSDTNWPTPELAKYMEELGTQALFEGFEIAVFNGRGAVSHSPWEGGGQERSLAGRYQQLAEHARPASPKLSETFLRIAKQYDASAPGG